MTDPRLPPDQERVLLAAQDLRGQATRSAIAAGAGWPKAPHDRGVRAVFEAAFQPLAAEAYLFQVPGTTAVYLTPRGRRYLREAADARRVR